ncbi:MAG: hypothetical protein HOV79_31290 [Hamadaea sp.]|nr:hypothetical protein [Hamadaea sp.]
MRAPGSRLAAWIVDWFIISGYAVALIPLGMTFGSGVDLTATEWNLVSFGLLILPSTLWLAAWESRGASPGKRRLSLRIADGADRLPGFGRALACNLLKVALPWELAHTGVFLILTAGDDGLGTVFTSAAWVVVLAYAAFLFRDRMPYDRVTGLRVLRRPAGEPAR